ncbi:MAG: hypothetical protein P4L28_02305 [Paludibacteraceae bacterium]|nr:hypothetical protein [Paludibacteraceae bacterium]
MDLLTVILAATIPAVLILIIVYLVIDKMLKAENTRRNFEVRKSAMQTMTPIRLKAYERMVIFLERINPESILTRQTLKDTSALQLQSLLLQQIRQEWEHNISQQLYIKADSWIMLRNAKESMVQLINTCAAEATMSASALDFAKLIIETYQSVEKTPLDAALAMLKVDIAKMG